MRKIYPISPNLNNKQSLATHFFWGITKLTVIMLCLFTINLSASCPSMPTVTSTTSGGLWSVGSTWAGGVVPVSTDQVIIADGATVIIDGDIIVASLVVGQGVSGILTFDGVAARSFTVTGDITVTTGGTLITQANAAITTTGDISSTSITNVASTAGIVVGMNILGSKIPLGTTITAFTSNTITLSAAATAATAGAILDIGFNNTLFIGGDIINNGTFDLSMDKTASYCNAVFTKSGNQEVKGTTPLQTRFKGISLTKVVTTNRVIASVSVSFSGSGLFLPVGTDNKGVWEQNAGMLTNTSGSQTLGVNNELLISNSGGYTSSSADLKVDGTFTMNTSGIVTIGSASAIQKIEAKNTTGSKIVLTQGTLNLFGKLNTGSDNSLTINGANINFAVSTDYFLRVENITASSFNWNSGTVSLLEPTASTAVQIKLTTSNISGTAKLVVGAAGSTAGSFKLDIRCPLNNLTINSGVAGVDLITSSLSVNGVLEFISGKINIAALNLTFASSTGASASSYIYSASSGFIKSLVNGLAQFPIGTLTSYTPVSFSANTSSDLISAKVKNTITNPTFDNSSCVQLEWSLTETTPGGNDGTISFQWNETDQGANFNPALPVKMAIWNGTSYDITPVAVTGTNPYVATLTSPATLDGKQIVLGNFPIVSTITGGLWSAGSTWVGGVVPNTDDAVIIANGATVKIDGNYTVRELTVGQGTSGILTFDGLASRAFTVTGDITVASGGNFSTQASLNPTGDLNTSITITNVSSTTDLVVGMLVVGTGIPAGATVAAFDISTITLSTAATATSSGVLLNIGYNNTISIGGNIDNNGTFDMSLGNTAAICSATFTKFGDQTISGSGTTTRFRGITLAKGVVGNRVITSVDVSFAGSSGFLNTGSVGTWEQTAGTLTNTSGSQTIKQNNELIFSGSSNYNGSIAADLKVEGALTVNTTGTVTIGAGSNKLESSPTTSTGAKITLTKGTVNIFGKFSVSVGITLVIDGANINIDPQQGGNNITDYAFRLQNSTSAFTWTSGTITIVDPIATGGTAEFQIKDANCNISGTAKLVLGVGAGTSTGGNGYRFSFSTVGTYPIASLQDVTMNTGSNGVTLLTATSIKGDLAFTTGKITIGANNLTVGTISGFDSDKFVITSGIGLLKMNTLASGSVTYPIGYSATSYTPFVSTNNTSADFLGVKVKGSHTNATLDIQKCIKLEWQGNEGVAGGNNGTVTFQWNAADQGSSFDPNQPVFFGSWDGSKYLTSPVTVAGTGPYTVTMNTPETYPNTPVVFGNIGAFSYTVAASVLPALSGTIIGDGNFSSGASVSLVATPSVGYHFVNWTENGLEVSSTATYTFTASANRVLVANFTLDTYTIAATVLPASSGTITGEGTFNHGASVSLVATPAANYHFVNWTENGLEVSSTATYTFTATADRVLVANFAIDTYTITASVLPTSSGTITGEGTFDHGASVSLVATPATNYYFVNWTEGTTTVSVTATYTFTATANRALVANFALNVGIVDDPFANFKVYPNPFNNEIKLEGLNSQSRVRIYNLIGQVLVDVSMANQDFRINTQALNSGIYLITITNERGEKTTKKMIKK